MSKGSPKFDKRKILELREQGYTYQEIAEELGCTRQYIGQDWYAEDFCSYGERRTDE